MIHTKSPHTRGFTLIELLVVIAIIGILASVVLASLSSVRAKGRDARRASDMKQLQNALELYASNNGGNYPTTPTSRQVVNMNTGTADITPYIAAIPTDPTRTGGNGYLYSPASDLRSYTLLVQLEKNGSSWCSVSTRPGYPNWNGDPSDGPSSAPTNYMVCEF